MSSNLTGDENEKQVYNCGIEIRRLQALLEFMRMNGAFLQQSQENEIADPSGDRDIM